MFWEKFVELCLLNGTKPNPVAKELGISSGAVTKWKSGSIPHHTTIKKIADYFGVTVDYLLGKNINNNQNRILVPVLGRVAAGVPIEAIEYIEDYEELNKDEFGDGEYFGLTIHGDSMEPRMTEGDVVIVKQQCDVNNGETAIVIVNGSDATCKKIKKTPEGIFLISTNPAYDPKFYSNKEINELPIIIKGKVVELRAKY